MITAQQQQKIPANPRQETLGNPRREIAATDKQLRVLTRQLRHAQRLASVGTMAAMVVHEFNNLLTPIINYAQLAQKDPKLVEKALDSAITGGQRATAICQAILGMTHENVGSIQPFSLRKMIDETITAMARNPRQDRIDLTCDIPANLRLTACRIELQQVILNLLINARDAVMERPGKRRISVSANIVTGSLCLQITDNGGGISPEHIQRIFEPFFTTKGDSPDHKRGNGLGLALCRDILNSMDSHIAVESVQGTGTIFTITLPSRHVSCAA